MNKFNVRQVAVLGAGVMGAQIAAHLVNVRVPVVLFDLPAKEGPKNGVVTKAVDNLKKLRPAPLGIADEADRIRQANYEEHLELLKDCDLVIEAIAERMDWKLDLYRKIAPHVAPHAIVASNTSGLSITKLSEAVPESMRARFCGIHFFNPPRYMALVELIPTPSTDAAVLDKLETFVTATLGKSVVRAKDTPNFVANRVGIAGMLATIKEAGKFGLSFDVVDDLTGKKMGRASSGTFRTADVVGLDTMAHVIRTMQDNLKDDPFAALYATPPVLESLMSKGALGQKTGAGFYKKVGKDILRFDAGKGDYVAGAGKADEIVARMLKKPAAERLKLLRESSNPQAKFVWAILRDGFHYAAVHLESIADTARDVDFAMRWGFGSSQGPFELWQATGWKQVAEWVKADIDAGVALSKAPLPAWVFDGPVAERGGVHHAEGSWSPSQRAFVPVNDLPVYARQAFRESVGTPPSPLSAAPGRSEAADAPPRGAASASERGGLTNVGTEVYKNDEIRVWTLDGQVLIASFTSKLHLIGQPLVEGLAKAIEIAERDYQGLVIWSPDDVFSAGANLEALMPVFMKEGSKGIAPHIKQLQDTMLRMRYAQVPVVAAMRGLALGGGCEIALYTHRRVAAMETYVGLVEVGVGLLPAGGGLAAIARKAAESQAKAPGTDLLAFFKDGFTAAASATVGTSALESRKLAYLGDDDIVVAHKDELLNVASAQLEAMAASGWRPPVKPLFPVAGRHGIATIKAQLVGMRDGNFITAHDFHLGSLIADVICGGDIDAGMLVSEEYLMALERKHFVALLDHPKTQERIMGMLSTGKPVRN